MKVDLKMKYISMTYLDNWAAFRNTARGRSVTSIDSLARDISFFYDTLSNYVTERATKVLPNDFFFNYGFTKLPSSCQIHSARSIERQSQPF